MKWFIGRGPVPSDDDWDDVHGRYSRAILSWQQMRKCVERDMTTAQHERYLAWMRAGHDVGGAAQLLTMRRGYAGRLA